MTLKAAIVLPAVSRGWIIEKMAVKLAEGLVAQGAAAEVVSAPLADAQINHFMMFHHVEPIAGTINTVGITHVDDALKVDMIKRQLARGVRAAICMSSMTAEQLAGYGIDRSRLTVVLPAHDGAMTPRRIVVGMTSQGYADGRKREWMLTQLAQDMRLDAFEFQFFGSGWREFAAQLQAAGAATKVTEPSKDYLADYAAITEAVPRFDYYFYPGLDEGSMGTLDALAAGVKTIVTRQGFHLDLPNGITHGFWDYPEMLEIFRSVAAERNARSDMAAELTWDRYAARHLHIWRQLLADDTLPAYDRLSPDHDPTPPRPFEVLGYRELIANPFRREMALKFWIPGLLGRYRATRSGLGRFARLLRGAA